MENLKTYLACQESKEWPGYTGKKIKTLKVPRWATDPQSAIIPDADAYEEAA